MSYYFLVVIFLSILSPVCLLVNLRSIKKNEVSPNYAKKEDITLLNGFAVVCLTTFLINFTYCCYKAGFEVGIPMVIISLVISPILLKIARYFILRYNYSSLKPKERIYYEQGMVFMWTLFCGIVLSVLMAISVLYIVSQ